MITNGKFFNYITDPKVGKYSDELKSKIEEMGKLCLSNLANDSYSPIMMLGSIQSGKTRAFIGLMSLCFDNDFDITIILTKCSKALVEQTVKRMESEFAGLKKGSSTVGDVVAQNILDISFTGATTEEEKEKKVKTFLKHYPDKKRIIVVKKQADNVDRMNMLIKKIVEMGKYKRILIVDDEADITTIGYQKDRASEELSLRRISGAINTARKQMNSDIQHVLMQVTATPYALYLQPGVFSVGDIMPIRPERTVVLPTGKGYIGANYYFRDSIDVNSPFFERARHLAHNVDQDEMNLLNGSSKNKSKGKSVKDGRTVKKENFLEPNGKRYAFPTFRAWVFDCLVGAAIVQLDEEYKDCYLSAVLHLAISKAMHKVEMEILEVGLDCIKEALENDIHDQSVYEFAKTSYDELLKSVNAYGVLPVPSFQDVMDYIAHKDEDDELEGLITSVVVKEINSDNDIERLLNSATGELRLEDKLTIFVGGQVIDRGITIPNLISFFYGRDPLKMQQDTVMQHCRMFGYRGEELLSVTRLYTTERLLKNLQEIAERDAKLRERMENGHNGGIVYLESGSNIIACSPDKILASAVKSILPGKRYLPVGFELNSTSGTHKKNIDKILAQAGVGKQKDFNKKRDKLIDESYCNFITKDDALELIRQAYAALEPDLTNGKCNQITDIENVFLFSVDEQKGNPQDKIAVLVRRGRQLRKFKKRLGVDLYQDAPEDGNNEGAIAQELRNKYPVLLLIEQCHPDWKKPFWWPVYYTPEDMPIGIYAEDKAAGNIYENVFSMAQLPMAIENFPLIDMVGLGVQLKDQLEAKIKEIKDFHFKNFDFSDEIKYDGTRTKFDCNIYVDYGPNEKEEKRFIRKVNNLSKKVEELLEQDGPVAKLSRDIRRYFKLLSDQVFNEETDALHDKLIDELNALGPKCVNAIFIRKYIEELDPLLHDLFEVLGYFIPKGSGKCEIHIYFERLREMTHYNDDELVALMSYVMAHEMEHAWHYADVMTESGKWLFTRKAYLKQGWVQEAIAEYFAFSYSKQMQSSAKKVAVDMVKARDMNKFPRDGGYSGALYIEKDSKEFSDMYVQTLTDLPYAYDKYLKKYAK